MHGRHYQRPYNRIGQEAWYWAEGEHNEGGR